jgi:hypothetical protein
VDDVALAEAQTGLIVGIVVVQGAHVQGWGKIGTRVVAIHARELGGTASRGDLIVEVRNGGGSGTGGLGNDLRVVPWIPWVARWFGILESGSKTRFEGLALTGSTWCYSARCCSHCAICQGQSGGPIKDSVK